jgi:hypothetical protein
LQGIGFWPALQASGGSSLTLQTSGDWLRSAPCDLSLTSQESGGLLRSALCG